MREGARSADVRVTVVGSVALDSVETPFENKTDLLGGSCSYACAAASLYAPVGMVGVVGDDFPDEARALYRRFGIDLSGLQTVPGRTFRWSGAYDEDMINRRTLLTELNVFEQFSPELPEAYRRAPFLLLGNISPELQLHVLSQADGARFVAADTMDLWINIARDALMEVIRRVHFLALNDSEARLLTDCHHLTACARAIREMGPRYVVIKKGEHGAMLFSPRGIFLVPAYPVETVRDPTGAGDTFAGGFLGRLAEWGEVSEPAVRESLLHGSVVASFGVEAFGLDGLEGLRRDRIDARMKELNAMRLVSEGGGPTPTCNLTPTPFPAGRVTPADC